jgi:DNA processing protein
VSILATESSGFVFHAWLASAALPPGIISRLLEEYGTPENVRKAIQSGHNRTDSIPAAGLKTLKQNDVDEWLEKEEQLLLQNGIKAFTIKDHEYPATLLQMEEPPAILFYQGNPQCMNQKNLAMVGSRAASYAGQKAAGKIARNLSRKGIGIISGMAGGIDTASHAGCIEGGSRTIAVTGCGLDIVYPSSNIRLRDRILENDGLLLSEYAPGEKPVGWHFPFRNRIITGLARALIVIEAKIRSGTMTSVQHALSQGKDVFVYPGDPTSLYFEGNHRLLREGAIYFTTAEDILEDLGWLDNPGIIRQNSDCSDRTQASTPEEKAVLSALEPGKLGFEQIADRSGLSPAALMSTLTMLQIKGMIEALPGKQYQLKDKDNQHDSDPEE